MQSIIQEVASHPLVQVGGFVLGVVGVILAIVFYARSRRTSKLRYDSTGRSLVEGLSGALEGIEVRYKGEPQGRVTVARFAFWNAGTETLRSVDFTDDPLRILTNASVKVLDHRIIDHTDPTNKIALADAMKTSDGDRSIAISFDYLDPGDGAVLQFVHDGPQNTRFELAGTLKGNCSISQAESPAFRMDTLIRRIPIPLMTHLVKSVAFGWFGSVLYAIVGIGTFIMPILGKAPWWLMAVSPFAWLGAWVMIYAGALGQVPTRLQSQLSRLPEPRRLDG